MLSFKHSGNIGDLIYSLPVIKYYTKGKLYLNPFGFTEESIDFVTPLLLGQEYINSVKSLHGNKFDLNLDLFRNNFKPKYNLCHCILNTFDVPLSTINAPWLKAPARKIANVIFNRTARYKDNKAVPFLKILASKNTAAFIGYESEWKYFNFNIHKIPYYKAKDLLDFASVIAGADLFVGNQSSAMAIAIALNHPNIIQEVSEKIPNCMFSNKRIKYINKLKVL